MISNWLLNSCALPLVGVFTGARFFSLYRNYVARPENTFSPNPETRLQKLRSLLQHAYDTVPLHRERMDEIGFRPDSVHSLDALLQLPPLTKSDISANFPDRVTSSQQLFAPWRYRSTSGTIERLTVVHDSRKRDIIRALALFSLYSTSGYKPGMRYLEIPPDVCRNVCGASDAIEPPLFRYALDNLRTHKLTSPEVISDLRGMFERQYLYHQKVLPSFATIGLKKNVDVLDACLKEIDKYQPAVLKALPVYLYMLAVHILDRNLPPPRITHKILPMGGSITAQMKTVVESAFRCEIGEDYGSAELGSIAAECRHRNGMHVFADNFIVEVVHNGNPAKSGELGRILITDLSNFAMPMIRYDIGDLGVLHESHCSCGVKAPLLEVQGRHQDSMRAVDGTPVTQDKIIDALLVDPSIFLFQLEGSNDKGELHLQLVPRNGHAPDPELVSRKLNAMLGGDSRVTTRIVPYIQPERGGKYRFVKNNSSSQREL